MIKKDFEAFMYIGTNKLQICIFSKIDSKILYKKEYKFTEPKNQIDEIIIYNFLSDNIFKIEKQLNQYVNNFNLIIDSSQFHSIHISIKQNIYAEITKKNQISMLSDLKNLIQESYVDYSVIHYVVNHYLVDNNIQKNLNFSKKCNHVCIEAIFILLSKENIFFYKKIFEKFQISVDKILCGTYIMNFFNSNEFNECQMGLKISSGFNPNEVFSIQKSVEKKGFFERFFYFFN